MSEDRILTRGIAEQYIAAPKPRMLTEYTSIEDTAAESLSRFSGEALDLYGLTNLSATAAEILSRYSGYLFRDWEKLSGSATQLMRTKMLLTKEIAQQYLEDEDSVPLDAYWEIENAAAESLRGCLMSIWSISAKVNPQGTLRAAIKFVSFGDVYQNPHSVDWQHRPPCFASRVGGCPRSDR